MPSELNQSRMGTDSSKVRVQDHSRDDSDQHSSPHVGINIDTKPIVNAITSTVKNELKSFATIYFMKSRLKKLIYFDAVISILLLIWSAFQTTISLEFDVGLISFPIIMLLSCVVGWWYKFKEESDLSTLERLKIESRFWDIVYYMFIITHVTVFGQYILTVIAIQSVNTSDTVTAKALLYLCLSTVYGLITLRIGQTLHKLCSAINDSIVMRIMKKI